jgi:hypothetical protein
MTAKSEPTPLPFLRVFVAEQGCDTVRRSLGSKEGCYRAALAPNGIRLTHEGVFSYSVRRYINIGIRNKLRSPVSIEENGEDELLTEVKVPSNSLKL